jgi:hypothetical protein
MPTYTYDQFEQALAQSGYTFSAADLALAKEYPDAGMAILQYKKDWFLATTPEEKQAANDGANGVRSNYGNYTGGADGAQYYLQDPTPSNYDMEEYINPYKDQLNAALEDLTNRDPYSSQYDDRINTAFDNLTNRDPYSSQYEGQINDILSGNYDISSNPMYQSYAKANAREAQRSAQDALGSAVALTGGMPSSYATTAASQAADYYNSQTADAVPGILANTLSQLQTQDNTDYQRYLDQIGLTRDDISMMQSLDDTDYQRYLDEIGLSRDDVNTLLSVTSEDYNRFSTGQQMAYQQWLDNLEYKANRDDVAKTHRYNAQDSELNGLLNLYSLTEDEAALKKLRQILGL